MEAPIVTVTSTNRYAERVITSTEIFLSTPSDMFYYPGGYHLQEQIRCTSPDQPPQIARIKTYWNMAAGGEPVPSGCSMHPITIGTKLVLDPVFKGIGAVQVDVNTFRFTTVNGDTLTVGPDGLCEVIMASSA